jgi:molybdopterin-containing oxidoreductase family membrane subunit
MTTTTEQTAAAAGNRPPRPQILGPGQTYETVTDHISGIILTKHVGKGWLFGFTLSFLLLMVMLASVGWLLMWGIGVWGLNQPVGWAFDITNFVWWVGIGHAGTLISAILLLLKQEWRTSINRFAEAMTLFAVACAGLFPALHVGRPWLAFYLFPYPNTMGLWPQFRSPLEWDVFAVSTYATVSFLFWFVGLVPDLATMRDRADNRFIKAAYGVLALGWRGSALHWHRYEMAYLLLAGLATPLVVSVHTVVSFDFAVGVLPGWHTTVFPPYFVAGAIFSGFAMVLTLTIPLRKAYNLEAFITTRHLDNMGKVILATGLIVAYGYLMEIWTALYSGNIYEEFSLTTNRWTGPYWYCYWALIACNVLAPQALWFKSVRTNAAMLFVLSLIINVGMWLERFIIIVTSLHRDFLPSSWGMFYPSIWDIGLYVGSLGLFFSLLFLFIRVLPVISVFEMRELITKKRGHGPAEPATGAGGATTATETLT